jgi:F0F1-type ATP synthase membrane subunit b/b'
MEWSLFSFFITHEEDFLEFNTNLLETNVFNILLLLGLLLYGYQTSFRGSLEARQKQIIQTIENAQKDVLNATNYYFLAEKGYTQNLFWFQSWKTYYEKEKVSIVENKYQQVQVGILETFQTTEILVANLKKKAFLSLRRYILFLTASRILRKFFFLSEKEQSKMVESIIQKLGGLKK